MRKFVIYANNGSKIELMCNTWELRHNGQTLGMLDEQQRPIAVFNFKSIIGVICDDLDEEDQDEKKENTTCNIINNPNNDADYDGM